MNRSRLRKQRLTNLLSTLGLFAAMVLVVLVVGRLVMGPTAGLLLAGSGAILLLAVPNTAPLWFLRRRGARPIDDRSELASWNRELARRAGLSAPPTLLWLPDAQPLAFSTGMGDGGVIALSHGLLRTLPGSELLAVMAHEISHLKHRDIPVLAAARVLGSLGRFLARVGLIALLLMLPLVLVGTVRVSPWALLVLLVAPLVLRGLEQALSRAREFDADAGAAGLTGDPMSLARALDRIDRLQRRASWWLGALAMRVPAWLASHPPTGERIARLSALTPSRRARPFGPPQPWTVAQRLRLG
jgi:heat shock protein HtpX